MSDEMAALKGTIDELQTKAKAKTISPAERLKLKRLKLDLEELRLNAKAARNQDAKRKIETRQKVILGSWVMHVAKSDEMKSLMRGSLIEFLDERDRAFLSDFLETHNV